MVRARRTFAACGWQGRGSWRRELTLSKKHCPVIVSRSSPPHASKGAIVVAERLMGIETEYAVSAVYTGGSSFDHSQLVNRLLGHAREKLINLPDIGGGLYLGNGARFYLDYGNHPELTTPECTNPWDIVRYVLAGEQILAGLAKEVASDLGPELMVFKSNVDYASRWVNWGCHESYMHREAPTRFLSRSFHTWSRESSIRELAASILSRAGWSSRCRPACLIWRMWCRTIRQGDQ